MSSEDDVKSVCQEIFDEYENNPHVYVLKTHCWNPKDVRKPKIDDRLIGVYSSLDSAVKEAKSRGFIIFDDWMWESEPRTRIVKCNMEEIDCREYAYIRQYPVLN